MRATLEPFNHSVDLRGKWIKEVESELIFSRNSILVYVIYLAITWQSMVSHLNGQKQDFLNKELPSITRMKAGGCPGGSLEKKPPANAGDTGSNPGPGWSHMLPGN